MQRENIYDSIICTNLSDDNRRNSKTFPIKPKSSVQEIVQSVTVESPCSNHKMLIESSIDGKIYIYYLICDCSYWYYDCACTNFISLLNIILQENKNLPCFYNTVSNM